MPGVVSTFVTPSTGSTTVVVTGVEVLPCGSGAPVPSLSRSTLKVFGSDVPAWLPTSFKTTAWNSITTCSTAAVVSAFVRVPSLKNTSVPLT